MEPATALMLSKGIGAVGSVLGGLIGKSGVEEQNAAQIKMAREQMDFQERMSNTAYQRSAKDLSQAGLNRILALGKPASSPAGAMPTIHSAKAPVAAAAANTANIIANTGLQIAQTKQLEAQTGALGGVSAFGTELGKLVNWITGKTKGEGDNTPIEPKGMIDRFMEDAGNTLKKLWWMPGNQTTPGSPGQAEAKTAADKVLGAINEDPTMRHNILTFVKKMDHPPGLDDDQLILWALANPERVKAYRERNLR